MKRKLIHIPLVLCALILTMASNCKKPPIEKPKDPITLHYTLGDVADYMVFKKGTYWVYENDLTGDIDSQWVTGSTVGEYTQNGTEDYSKQITLIQEYFQVNISSNFIDGLGNKSKWEVFSNGAAVNGYPSPTAGYLVEKRRISTTGGSINDVFIKPFYIDGNRSVYQTQLLTNYNLKGSIYDTVRVFRVGRDNVMQESSVPTGLTGKSDYYYAKNVGLIKVYSETYRLLDQKPWFQSWNLIRKKIIQ